MEYPLQENELRECYRSYIGKEPDLKTSNLLIAVMGMLNEAYIEGVEEGMSRIKRV